MPEEKGKINFKKLPEIFCKECRKNKKMTFVGGNDEVGLYWLKCPTCHQNYSFSNDELEEINSGRKLAADNNKKRKVTTKDNGNGNGNGKHEEYSPRKMFYIGQTIYHKTFDDTGKVIEKNKGSDIGGRIVVSFNKCGIKKLVEGLQVQ